MKVISWAGLLKKMLFIIMIIKMKYVGTAFKRSRSLWSWWNQACGKTKQKHNTDTYTIHLVCSFDETKLLLNKLCHCQRICDHFQNSANGGRLLHKHPNIQVGQRTSYIRNITIHRAALYVFMNVLTWKRLFRYRDWEFNCQPGNYGCV